MPFDFFSFAVSSTQIEMGPTVVRLARLLELPVYLFKLVGNKRRAYVGLCLLRVRQRATALATTIFKLSQYKGVRGQPPRLTLSKNGNFPLFIVLQGSDDDTTKFLTIS
jgi:hypothetical protein